MIEIRFHGRGGQGAVTTGELLAKAAISEGKWAQAFPAFGPERRGAPVLAFCRVSESKIQHRFQVKEPDIVVVLDPSLLDVLDPSKGLKSDGLMIVNSPLSSKEIKRQHQYSCKVAAIDASTIAREILRLNITNTTMLGALVKASKLIKLSSLDEPFKERFGKVAENNLKACHRAFDQMKLED